MLTGFDHLTVAVRDLASAVSQYSALLGFGPSWRGTHAELGTEAALFGLGNGMLELVAPLDGDSRADGLLAQLESAGDGPIAFAFATHDAAACRTWLRERGVRAAPVVEGTAHASGAGSAGGVEPRVYRVVELSPSQARGLSVYVVERPDRAELLAPADRSADRPHAIDHLVVSTADPDAAVAFYGEQLGVRLALDRELSGGRMLFFRLGGVTLEVVQTADQAATDRIYGIAYRVSDAEAAHARLAREGFALTEPRDGNKPGTRVFTVRGGTCGVPTLIIADPSRQN